MVARSTILAVIATALLGTLGAGTQPQDCSKFAPPHHVYKNAAGQYFCARHRRPLIHSHVFSMPSPLPIIEFEGEMRRVGDCNPNALYPYASLHRTKGFSEAGFLDYCPDCEKAVLVAVERIEADYNVRHH